MTRYTIVERGRMLRELAAVRRNGYARTVGGDDAAAPARSPCRSSGRPATVVAALGLVIRTVRRDLTRYVPALLVASAEHHA